MAALLRDWLAHTIEQELKLAIEWHHAQSSDGGGLATQRPSEDLLKQVKVEDDYEAYLASPAQIKPETKYTNDGSNLRVECSRDMTSLRWVQLVKFITFKGAIQALVSDAHTTVKVTFSSEAVRDFIKKKGKPLTEGTCGGVMHINQYEIVATTFGASVGHVSLRIQNFDYKGGILNPTIGRPIAVEERVEISALLPEIGALLGAKRAESDTYVSTSQGSVVSSSANKSAINSDPTIVDLEDRNGISILASQAIPIREEYTRKPPHKISDIEVIGGVNLGAPRGAGRVTLGPQPSRTNTTGKEMADKLLRALGPVFTKSKRLEESKLPSPGVPTLTSPADSTVVSTPSEELTPLHSRDPATNSVTHRADERALNVNRENLTEQQDYSDKSAAREQSPVSNQGAEAEGEGKNTCIQKPMAFDAPTATVHGLARQVEFHEGNFLFVHRFKSEFTASKVEDDAILKRPESWQHPEVGYKFVPPNLPGALLGALNSLAEKRAKKGSLLQSDRHQLSSRVTNASPSKRSMEILNKERDFAEEEINSPSQSNPFSEEEWPPSQPIEHPARKLVEELPIDSSANVIPQSSCSSKPSNNVMDGPAKLSANHRPSQPGGHPRTNVKNPDCEIISSFETNKDSDQDDQRSGTHQRVQNFGWKDTDPPSSPPVLNQGSGQSETSEINDDHENRSQNHMSDMEMKVPHALGDDSQQPAQHGHLASKPFSTDTRHAKAKTQVAETPYTRNWSDQSARHGPPHTPWTAPQQQRNSWRSSQDSQKKTSIYPDTYVPGTFYSDQYVAPQIRQVNVVAVDGVFSSDPPGSMTDDIVGQQLRDEINAASQRSDKESLAKNKFNSSASGGLDDRYGAPRQPVFGSEGQPHILHFKDTKRKADDLPSLNGSLKDVKRARLQHDLLGHGAQVVEDPSIAARKSRSEFMRNAKKSIEATAKAPQDQATPPPALLHWSGPLSDNVEMHDAMETISKSSPPRSQLTMQGVFNQPRRENLGQSSQPRNLSQSDTAAYGQSRNTTNITLTQNPTQSLNIFRFFSDKYPGYTGDLKHFLGVCRTIDKLSKDGRMQHKSLWDDFIIRHKTHYSLYLRQCIDEGESPLPYERFYSDRIDEPVHNLRIMNPGNLSKALAQHDKEGITASKRIEGIRHRARSSSSDASSSRSPEQRDKRPITALYRFDRRHPAPPFRELPERDHRRPPYPRNPTSVPASRNYPAPTPTQTAARPLPWSQSSETSKPKPSSSSIRRSSNISYPERRTDKSKGTTTAVNHIVIDSASPSPTLTPTAPPRLIAKHISQIKNMSLPSATAESADLSESEWWKDESTPFKIWARQYAELKVLNGSLGKKGGRNVLTPRVKTLDVLAWCLSGSN